MIKMKENIMLMVTWEYSSIEARCERVPMEWTINIVKNESVILGIQIRPVQNIKTYYNIYDTFTNIKISSDVLRIQSEIKINFTIYVYLWLYIYIILVVINDFGWLEFQETIIHHVWNMWVWLFGSKCNSFAQIPTAIPCVNVLVTMNLNTCIMNTCPVYGWSKYISCLTKVKLNFSIFLYWIVIFCIFI